MIFRKAEKEDFYKIRSLYWSLINQEQDAPWERRVRRSFFLFQFCQIYISLFITQIQQLRQDMLK